MPCSIEHAESADDVPHVSLCRLQAFLLMLREWRGPASAAVFIEHPSGTPAAAACRAAVLKFMDRNVVSAWNVTAEAPPLVVSLLYAREASPSASCRVPPPPPAQPAAERNAEDMAAHAADAAMSVQRGADAAEGASGAQELANYEDPHDQLADADMAASLRAEARGGGDGSDSLEDAAIQRAAAGGGSGGDSGMHGGGAGHMADRDGAAVEEAQLHGAGDDTAQGTVQHLAGFGTGSADTLGLSRQRAGAAGDNAGAGGAQQRLPGVHGDVVSRYQRAEEQAGESADGTGVHWHPQLTGNGDGGMHLRQHEEASWLTADDDTHLRRLQSAGVGRRLAQSGNVTEAARAAHAQRMAAIRAAEAEPSPPGLRRVWRLHPQVRGGRAPVTERPWKEVYDAMYPVNALRNLALDQVRCRRYCLRVWLD